MLADSVHSEIQCVMHGNVAKGPSYFPTLAMKKICDVLGDGPLLQILFCLLCGDVQKTSLALPNGQLKLLGMRCVLHLLTSCRKLLVPHRSLTHQWRAQFYLDDQHEACDQSLSALGTQQSTMLGCYTFADTLSHSYACIARLTEAEKEAMHRSINGSSSESDAAAEDAYYARQESGETDCSSEDEADCLVATTQPLQTSPIHGTMSAREYFYTLQRQWYRSNNLPCPPVPGDDSD